MSKIKNKMRKRPESKNPIIVKRRENLLDKIKEISNMTDFPEVVNIENGFSLINRYKLTQLLNQPLSTPFRCMISKHKFEDKESAQLIEHKGTEYYVCKYCKSGDYISVFDALCGIMGLGSFKLQLAIFKKLGLKISSNHKEETNKIIEHNISLITDVIDSNEYPYLNKSNLLNLYIEMLEYTSDKLPLIPFIKNSLIISIPLSVLSNYLKSEKLNGVDKGTLSRKTNLLTYIGLIRKEPLENLPEDIQKDNSNRKSNPSQQKYYDKTYWNFPILTGKYLIEAENKLKFLKNQHITLKNFTAAKFKFLLGIQQAKELFPAKKFYHAGIEDELVKFDVEDILKKQGWFLSDEIADRTGVTNKKAPILLDKLLYEEKIRKVKVSNEIRKKYNIPTTIHTNCMIYIDYAA